MFSQRNRGLIVYVLLFAIPEQIGNRFTIRVSGIEEDALPMKDLLFIVYSLSFSILVYEIIPIVKSPYVPFGRSTKIARLRYRKYSSAPARERRTFWITIFDRDPALFHVRRDQIGLKNNILLPQSNQDNNRHDNSNTACDKSYYLHCFTHPGDSGQRLGLKVCIGTSGSLNADGFVSRYSNIAFAIGLPSFPTL